MKTLINESLQSLQVCLINPGENSTIRSPPRGRATIHDDQLSQMALNLAKKKLIKIVNSPNPVLAVDSAVSSKLKKS